MSTRSAVFPLSHTYLPGDLVSLRIFEDRYVRMIEDITSSGKPLCTVLIERGAEVGGSDLRTTHGVSIDVIEISQQDTWHLLGRAHQVVTIESWDRDDPYPSGLVSVQTTTVQDATTRRRATEVLDRLVALLGDALAPLRSSEDDTDPEAPWRNGIQFQPLAGNVDPLSDDALWSLFWGLSRRVPCGALDRYELLKPGALTDRLSRLEAIVQHVHDIIRFRTQN